MYRRSLIYVIAGFALFTPASASPITIHDSAVSPLHPRGVPLSFNDNIATGIARVHKLYPQAHLLSITGRASPRTRAGLTTKWEPPRHVELKFDAQDTPHATRNDFGETMGLELNSSPEWGKWWPSPHQFYSYAALARLDFPFDFDEVRENGQTSFEDAVLKLTSRMGVTEREWMEGKFQVFARPRQGYLANSLPMDVYYCFEVWGVGEEGEAGGRRVSFVYMGVFSGDTFVNPKPGESGIVRRLSVDWMNSG